MKTIHPSEEIPSLNRNVPLTVNGALALPVVTLALAAMVWFSGWNKALFLALHDPLLQMGGAIWANLTVLGDSAVTPLLMVIYVRRRPDLLWAAFLGSLVAYGYSHGLKPVVDELRPPAVLDIVVVGRRLMHSSFPSGHTTTIFVLAGLLILGVPIRSWGCRAGIMALAILVGLSRIGVGVHWPVDVLVGAAGGWLSAVAGLMLAKRWTWGERGAGRIVPLVMLFTLCLYNLFGNPTGFPEAWWLQKGVSVMALGWGCLELYGWWHESQKNPRPE
jgi:membrane-associated phospholipid phosphatase